MENLINDKKFVVINDELRFSNSNDYRDLLGDNKTSDLKLVGLWRIVQRRKSVYFYGVTDPNGKDILSRLRNSGFYSPLIQGYKWFYSELLEPNDYIEI